MCGRVSIHARVLVGAHLSIPVTYPSRQAATQTTGDHHSPPSYPPMADDGGDGGGQILLKWAGPGCDMTCVPGKKIELG